MRLWVIRLLLALSMPVMAAAQAQLGKPDALPPATGGRMAPAEPGGKPPPLPRDDTGSAAAPRAPAAPTDNGQAAPRCAQPLASNCLAQQSSCQIACPPMWSTNPSAPAFTPTDRAGCMRQCQQRYFSCMRLYGCM
ncbi:hypothetical protein JMJ56_12565 [Belnapia sp. T18]|uniref:Uncharacterized protein n=1 Tax=Belnapia arida TaxID=2804533 RepID=A0ABS1U2D1_9PROT|nr:hypothetical protein [Belnapia arida]MBL6078844.1 hypothetical protein [Belnapia arida]